MRLREVGQAWSGLEEAHIVVFAEQGHGDMNVS